MVEVAPRPEALRRLAKDVRALQGDALADHGVFYQHDEANVLCGQAVIIGAPGTPYAHGCYVFNFRFPPDYPHRPPTVLFATGDGVTRFNPNLYRNGKVCLSILNTWQGPQWTGCQTISSVLLSLKGNVLAVVLPLLNEPGVTARHADFARYHEILEYKNVEIAVWRTACEVARGRSNMCDGLRSVVSRHYIDTHASLLEDLRGRVKRAGGAHDVKTSIYDMEVRVDYARLLDAVLSDGAEIQGLLKMVAQIDV
jgi:ubiquitin-conjugating enzyme E2 Z